MRTPLQGVGNIVRFNWHFYVVAVLAIVALLSAAEWALPVNWGNYAIVIAALIGGSTLLSLVASAYVYDFSDLYALDFIGTDENALPVTAPNPGNYSGRQVVDRGTYAGGPLSIVNINAGFDETSEILRQRYPHARLTVLDFYDPSLHTEVSISRARAAYPPYPGTLSIATDRLPLADGSADMVLLTLAAHEIRDAEERIAFFRECRRILAPNGRVYVTEHLRDAANFAVYNIGFLHFHSHTSWKDTFAGAGLRLITERKTTPFISTFILVRDAATN